MNKPVKLSLTLGFLPRSPATTSAWAGAAVPTSPAVPLPTRNAEDTLVMLADR